MQGIVPNTSSLNSIIAQNAGAINVRAFEFPLLVAQGRIQGNLWTLKSGRNSSIDTGTVPEDLWGSSGVYAGFPTGAAEIITAVSDNAGDTGTLTIIYLASATSTAYQTASVTLNGLTPVDFAVSGIRVHSASYNTGAATTFNLGNITIRHKVTTTNIFQIMSVGSNQTYSTGYTVPFGNIGYIFDTYASISDGATGSIEACFWTRLNGQSPRLRRNFIATQGSTFSDNLNGTLSFPALTDIILRVIVCSANNTIALGGYNILNVLQ